MGDVMLSDSGSDSTEELSGSEEGQNWIPWYCNLKGNEFLCEVEDEFIQDDFNLSGLAAQVPYYESALDIILDNESANLELLNDEQNEIVEKAAEMLYGMIHARYIVTAKGLSAMVEKFRRLEFGRCSRVLCNGQPYLPVGTSDIPGQSTVKLFCPKCEEIYYTKQRQGSPQLDGAYFGTTFPHLLLMSFSSLRPTRSTEKYVPKIFGFKIHETAYLTEAERQILLEQQQQLCTPPASRPSQGQAQSNQQAAPYANDTTQQDIINNNSIAFHEGTSNNLNMSSLNQQFQARVQQQQGFVTNNTQVQPNFLASNSVPPNTEEVIET